MQKTLFFCDYNKYFRQVENCMILQKTHYYEILKFNGKGSFLVKIHKKRPLISSFLCSVAHRFPFYAIESMLTIGNELATRQ